MRDSVPSKAPALVFVTEGHLDQLIGIGCILNVLKSLGLIHPSNHRTWIVAPALTVAGVREFIIGGCGGLDLRFVDCETRADDKYYLQLGLRKVFEETDAGETLLSLDYDHLILNPRAFRFSSPGREIIVSSEVQETVAAEAGVDVGEYDLPRRHLNASLIWGRALELRRVGALWPRSYEDLRPLVPQRNRVEVALSLAAERANVSLSPCPPAVQGNFAVPTLDCCLFHYGGETHGSKAMKSKLAELADDHRGRAVRPDDLLMSHELLVGELNSLLG